MTLSAAANGYLFRPPREAQLTKVNGLDRLLRQIAALPELQAQAASDAVKQGTEEMAAAIARAAPKHTGDMAKGVKALPVTEDRQGNAHTKGGAGLAFKVVAPFPARFVEFGTKASQAGSFSDAKGKARKNKRAHHATKAEPFFWPTIHAYQKRFRSRLSRNTNKAAKAAAAVR